MNRLFARIITGILLAYLAATILLHVITTLFWGRIFTDPTYYPVKKTAELVQFIIDNTPEDKVFQEIEYLSTVLDRPLDLASTDDMIIPEAVRKKLTDGRIIYEESQNGKKKFFAPVNNSSQVVVIDPSFQQYRPFKNIPSSVSLSIVVILIAVFVGFKLAKPLVLRLEVLESAAIRISHGDLTARVRNNSEDLVGKVEKCFNKMSDRIQALIATRQTLLKNILQKFEAPIGQIDECIRQWRTDKGVSQQKKLAQKINSVIKDITQLVDDLLRQEKNRQYKSSTVNTASAVYENHGNSTARDRKQSDAHGSSSSTVNPSALKASIVKFIFRISAGVFTVLLAFQLLMLIMPQITYKYENVNPSWYAAHTMSTLIQRAVDITPQEELPERLELLQEKFNRKLDLTPMVKAELLFSKILEREFPGGVTYGVLNEKRVFSAPVHSGAYALIIDTPPHLYRRNPSVSYHVMMLVGWFVLTFFFGILLSFPIIRNLTKLMEGIERLRMDDLNARVNIPATKPIGALASHFNSMAEHIQLLMENQRHLIQAVVHEIRTPLSRIRFHIEMLMDSEDREEMDREAEDIELEFKELELLLKELSTFMAFDAMSDKLELEPVSLHDALLEVVGYYQKVNRAVSIRLLGGNKNIDISVHPFYFKMAIRNLVSNALRHAKQNVSISYDLEKAGIVIDIGDDGSGIPDHSKKTVLEPFTRLDNSRNRKSGGLGLGLAIVNRIVQLHNGSIEIIDNFPQGAIVITYWPMSHPC